MLQRAKEGMRNLLGAELVAENEYRRAQRKLWTPKRYHRISIVDDVICYIYCFWTLMRGLDLECKTEKGTKKRKNDEYNQI